MISVEHLTKYYGEHLAVDDLSFEIAGSRVYGFLGPNGAGKSTTMNIMTGCLSATGGSIRIDGHDIFEEPLEAKRLIGYLPEQPPLYMNESPLDYLRFVGKAKGLRGAELSAQLDRVIQETGIAQVKNRRIATLSKGYKQRVGIAQALLGNPKVIILDEPTVGLDPLQIIEIRDLIRSLGAEHTVIFSSHILSEVQAICDEILMIAKGRLVAFDTPENLETKLTSHGEITLTVDAAEEQVRALLEEMPAVADVTTGQGPNGFLRVNLRTELRDIYVLSRAVFRILSQNGIDLLEMNLKKANLEDIFIELSEGNPQAEAQDHSNPEGEGTAPEGTETVETEAMLAEAADAQAVSEKKEEQAI